MKSVPALVFLLSSMAAPAWSMEDLVDPIVNQFLSELARRQGFTLLAAPSRDGAKIGSVYWVKDPPVRCAGDLRAIQSQAQPLSVEYLVDLDGVTPTGAIDGWTTVRIDNFLGAGAQAALEARFPGRRADIKAAVDYLRKVNAQISFAVVERPSFILRKKTTEFLKEQNIRSPGDLAADASGTLIPYAQLVLQSFQVDQEIMKHGSVGVGARFLQMFGVKLAGDLETASRFNLKMPTNAVFAFKADRMLVREACPS